MTNIIAASLLLLQLACCVWMCLSIYKMERTMLLIITIVYPSTLWLYHLDSTSFFQFTVVNVIEWLLRRGNDDWYSVICSNGSISFTLIVFHVYWLNLVAWPSTARKNDYWLSTLLPALYECTGLTGIILSYATLDFASDSVEHNYYS